jgi:hypothetical protein
MKIDGRKITQEEQALIRRVAAQTYFGLMKHLFAQTILCKEPGD